VFNRNALLVVLFASTSAFAAESRAASAADVPAAEAAAADAIGNEIVVTAKRANTTARSEERAAPNLINIQAAEEIVKYPDYNAAEALGRIPGVSLSIDTGEGRFVTIRGIDSNLNGTTFGGVTLLNTQAGGTYFGGGGRAVELDTIPIGSIDRLVVRKTGLPDQEAEGIGGSVELTPRTAAGLKGPFLEVMLGGGYNAFRKNGDVFDGEGAVGTTFGPSKQFGIVLTGSFHTDKRGFDDIEPGPLDAGVTVLGAPDLTFTDVALDSVDLRRYNYNRRRFGFGGELRWDPNPQSTYYLRANNAGYTESVNRQILQYRNLGDPGNNASLLDPNNAPNGYLAPNADVHVSLRDEQETHINFITSVGGRNDLGPVIIDYQVAYTAATYHRDYDYNSTFGDPAAVVSYDNISSTVFPRVTPIGFNPNDPTQFTLLSTRGGFSNTVECAHDREYSGVVNITIPTQLLGGDGSFRFGGKLRLRDKIDVPTNFSYGSKSTPLPAIPLTSVLGGGPYDFYGNRYSVGYSPDASKVRTQFIGNPVFVENVTADAIRSAGGFFNDAENVYAGYGEYEGKFAKLGVLAGLRVENTDATYRGIVITKDANGMSSFAPAAQKRNYTNFFPTVQLRYDLRDNLVARATYSTGIARPGFLQLVAGSRVDLGAQTVVVGNPNLKPFTANSFDGSLEYYLPNSGVISVGVFDKEISDYVLSRGFSTNSYPGFPTGTRFRVTSYNNVSSNTYIRGVEAQYVQKFTSLPTPFDGLGFSGNITYADSKVEIRPGEYSNVPGDSKLTYNVSLSYEAHKAQVRLSLLHVDATIFQIGSDPGLDVFEDQRTTLDLTSSYQLLSSMTVYFNAKNLLNTPLRYYEGSSNRQIQREYYQISYEAGVRLKF